MDFRQFLRVIFRYRNMIILMCLSAIITATGLTYVISEIYRSSTKVLIRPQKLIDFVPKREEILNFPVSYFMPIETASKTYTEIIKSRMIAERVVTLLHLDRIKEEEGSGWRYFLKKAMREAKDFVQKVWDLLRYGYIKEEDPFNNAVTKVQGGLFVKPTKETYLFELQAEAKSPTLSSDIANAAAKVFVEYLQEMSISDIEREKKLSEDKVKLSEQELYRARNAVAKFKEMQDIVSLKNEMELEVKTLYGLEDSRKSVETEIRGVLAKKEEITRQLAELEKFSKSAAKVIDNPLIRTLRSQLAEKEVKLAGLRELYTEEHKELQTLLTEISQIKNKLNLEAPTLRSEETSSIDPVYQDLSIELARVETQLESLKAKSDSFGSVIQEKKRKVEQMPQKEAELSRLELVTNLNEETHKLLSKEYEELRILGAKKAPNIRVIHSAFPPIYPIRPIKLYHAVLAGILSLITGVGIALLRENMNLTIRSIAEAEDGLALPVIMTIPYIRLARSIPSPPIEGKMAVQQSCLPLSFEEPIRGLRSDLQLWNSQKMSSFLITSSVPQEGKSTLISNLAVSLAANDKRVIVVDGNLRFPSLHEIFDLPNEKGLSTILSGDSQPALERNRSGLSILTSGPPISDPGALFESNKMTTLVNSLKKDFDFILIDSPPLLAGPDSALLASIAEGTIIVLSAGRTSMEDAQRAKNILERVHAKILGLVLNHYTNGRTGYYRTNRKRARASR